MRLKKNGFIFIVLGSLSTVLCNCHQQKKAVPAKETATAYYTINDFQKVKKIDAHVHMNDLIDTVFIDQARDDNFRMLTINLFEFTGTPVEKQQDFSLGLIKKYPDRLSYAAAFSLKNFNSDGWQQEVTDYLRDAVSKGAVAVKVWKNIGMELKDTAGHLVFIDNPKFDPVLDFMAKHNLPLIGHLGEHKNSWLPLEKMTVKGNRDYARTHPQEHMYLHPDRPSYEEYIRVRDHMLEKHPDLKFIGAHLGSLEWSVDELAKRLDKFPNMAVDMAERISHLQYQALTDWQKVHDFFIRYQDRLIYGTDMRHSAMDIVNNNITAPADLKKHEHEVSLRHWRFFTTDDVMNVPKVEGAFKGLKLPKEVVDKIYYRNALHWFPGIVR